MRFRAPLLALPLVFASVGTAPAQTRPAEEPATRPASGRVVGVDPEVRSLFGFRARTGKTPLAYRASERFERDGVLPVVVRFSSPLDPARLASLARAGVEWENGGAPLASGAYAAKITEAHLALLAAEPTLVRVTSDLPRNAPRPLDLSATETGIDSARRALRAKDGKLLDGTGTRIAAIDSGVFVFHPAFFRADAGTHAWVDVDEDGRLTPGVDGVDLDASGSIEPTEVLRELRADMADRKAGFDAAIDWLYVDENGNGQRDFGAGFSELTPAYGEPVFVVDDVDRDGALGRSEKLLRLGTSKVALARGNRTYTRGAETNGVITYGSWLVGSADRLEASSHGTGVAGILVGGVPDRSKLLGLAPGADLLAVGYGERDPLGTAASIQWAITNKADVILTEYAPYTGFPLDGSTEEEALLDSAVDKGIGVVTPAGNLSRGYKHRSVKLAVGDNEFPLQTDGGFKNAPYVAFTILHRDAALGDGLAVKLALPDGTSIDVPTESTGAPIDIPGGRLLDVVRRDSARGTHEIHVSLYAYDGTTWGKLPSGSWKLSITSSAAASAELFCADGYNSWAYGLVFTSNTASGTICHPATHDKGIAIAAYTLHGDDPFGGGTPGALASYSSMGPRIDGAVGIDLAAPDNPMSTGVIEGPSARTIRYDQFGGTSGAGPHVAAALALLKQNDPALAGAALQDALLSKARRDSFVTADATRWGKGKLDVAAALGIARNAGTPPTVKLAAPAEARIGTTASLALSVEDDAPGARAQWDLDYDGKPDTAWLPVGSQTITSDVAAVKTVRVDVLDADGFVRGATARIIFNDTAPLAPTPAADVSSSDDGCGCSTPGSSSPSNRATPYALALATLLLARRARSSARR